MRNSTIYNIFLVLVGIVLGSLVAKITAGVPALGWLSYALAFGFEEPLRLDLSVVHLTFALNVNLSVAVILFVAISLAVGHYLARR